MSPDDPTDTALRAAFESVVCEWGGVTTEQLFGFPAYRADGRLFAVLDAGGVALTRLPPEHANRLNETHETGTFEAYGQSIGKWDYVESDVDHLQAVVPYVEESYDAARSDTRSVPPPKDER